MEKVEEFTMGERIWKVYHSEASIIELFENMNFDGHNIGLFYASDGADVGMKSFGGNYTLEQLNNSWDEIKHSISSISFKIDNSKITIADGEITLSTPDPNMEIDEFLIQNQRS